MQPPSNVAPRLRVKVGVGSSHRQTLLPSLRVTVGVRGNTRWSRCKSFYLIASTPIFIHHLHHHQPHHQSNHYNHQCHHITTIHTTTHYTTLLHLINIIYATVNDNGFNNPKHHYHNAIYTNNITISMSVVPEFSRETLCMQINEINIENK